MKVRVVFIIRLQMRSPGITNAQKLELSDGFQENIFKGQVRDEVTGYVMRNSLVDDEVIGPCHGS